MTNRDLLLNGLDPNAQDPNAPDPNAPIDPATQLMTKPGMPVDPGSTGLPNPIETAAPTSHTMMANTPSDTGTGASSNAQAGDPIPGSGPIDPVSDGTGRQKIQPVPKPFDPVPPDPAPVPAPAPTPVTVPGSLQTDPALTAYNATMRQKILDQLNGDLSQPETAASSDIAPAIGAYTTQSQKDEQAARDQLAESAYASNGGTALQSGGFQTSLAANRENAAGQRANFTGQAVMQGAQAKRQSLQQMLQTATQFGDTQTAQQIQSQIALLDAQLQEQSLQQGFATSNNNLGFNYAQLTAQQNRDALLAGLNG